MKKEYKDTGYFVGECGTVYGKYQNNKPLKSSTDRYGYSKYGLCVEGKMQTRAGHRLVAETHIPNPNNLPQVNHIDGDKLNNHVSNLEWCTCRHNINHAKETGLLLAGEDNPKSIYTNDEIHEVCRLIVDGHRNGDIQKITGVLRTTISQIRIGNVWTAISDQYIFPKIAHQGFSMETFYWCCHRLQDGWSYKKILSHYTGKEYLTYSALKKIKARKMRPEYSKDFNF